MDPHLSSLLYDSQVTWMTTELLLKRDAKGVLVPALAESWSLTNDTTWVFKLRRGVKFHDGTPFNAQAVKANFDRLYDPATKSPRAVSRLGMIGAVEVVDELTVRFVTKFPYSPLGFSLAASAASAIASPAALTKFGLQDYSRNPVGTGPFKFREWVANDHITFIANDEYWDGRPYLDEVIYRFVPDAATRGVQLQSGEVDMVLYPEPAGIPALVADQRLTVVKVPQDVEFYLGMTHTLKPFDDLRVRQAVSYAIDTKTIQERIAVNVSQPLKSFMPPTVWGFNENVKSYPYNPEQAKRLLAEANVSNLDLELWHPTGRYPVDKQVAEAVQQYLRAVGINVALRSGDAATWIRPVNEGQAPLFITGWAAEGDPDSFLFIKFHTSNIGAAGNRTRFKNAKVDELLEKARAVFDQNARTKLYQEVQTILADNAVELPLYQIVNPIATNKKVQGVEYGPNEFFTINKAWKD